jgi:hypothetical protein
VATLTVPVDVDENTELYIPMVSRLMQLLVLDIWSQVLRKNAAEIFSHTWRELSNHSMEQGLPTNDVFWLS